MNRQPETKFGAAKTVALLFQLFL